MHNAMWGPDWPRVRAEWVVDPEIIFLNHGSFGATPRPVLDAQAALQLAMEKDPVRFLDRELAERLHLALVDVSLFLGTTRRRLAFVPNATTGVNTVLRNLDLEPGDELLISDHGYPAVIRTMHRVAEETGAVVRIQPVPWPETGRASDLADALVAGVTEKTRLVIVDHVASPSALVFPVAEIIGRVRERGALVLVDAAHGPGMFPIELDILQPDFWTGNLHKWVCAPKGCAVLWTAEEHAERMLPLVTSHYFPSGWPEEFNWSGTYDPSAFLAAPAALAWMGDNLGWDRVRDHNRRLVRYGQRLACSITGIAPPVDPARNDVLFGSMIPVPLPERIPHETKEETSDFQRRLFEEHAIEVPVIPGQERAHLRLSAQVYNRPEDYEILADALRTLLADS